MCRKIRFKVALAAVVMFASASGFAQSSGEATYKAKCQMCHGATGAADTGAGKATKTLPVSDPVVKGMSADDMVAVIKNGKMKMQPFKDKLSDQEIKDVAAYFRTLK
jgi:cytochrome c6